MEPPTPSEPVSEEPSRRAAGELVMSLFFPSIVGPRPAEMREEEETQP